LAGGSRWRAGRRDRGQYRPGAAAGRLLPGHRRGLRAPAMAPARYRRAPAGACAGDGGGDGLPAPAPARWQRTAGSFPRGRAAMSRRRRNLALLSLAVLAGASMTLVPARTAEYPQSPQFHDGAFHNQQVPRMPRGRESLTLWWKFLAGKRPATRPDAPLPVRSEEHTSELQSREKLVCRL